MDESSARDLDAAIALVAENYAGYRDKLSALGSARLEQAAEEARASARGAQSLGDADRAIRAYLSVFGDGHLWLTKAAGTSQSPARSAIPAVEHPSLQRLSRSTTLLTIPASFALASKAGLEGLLDRHEATIRAHRCLIIDLRGNTGGSDATYIHLLPYLYTGPIEVIGVDIFATAANTKRWEAMASMVPDSEPELAQQVAAIVSQMKARPAQFVHLPDERIELPLVMPAPARVGIVVDRQCASAVEQFLLAARQSGKVRLFGQPTRGVLDYSNPVEFCLPSGTRALGIPTSRSRRLPDRPVDGTGILPDVVLDPDDVRGWIATVQEHLERWRGGDKPANRDRKTPA